jgi:ABC-2 type transport system ATP-binding protein
VSRPEATDTRDTGQTGVRRHRSVATTFLVLALAAVGLTACSSTGSSSTPTTALGMSSTMPGACRPPSDWRSTTATAIPGIPSDYDLTSFDGTSIRIHWFPDTASGGASGKAVHPTVLMGPGWGQAGDTDTTEAGVQGALSIAQLRQGGFNVLTWDPRGFGQSGGEAEVDSPAYEGRDVTAIINWVARQPGVELDRPGVPRVGMVGESYGGGVQFVAAAQDCRIDAIAPTIAWNSLGTSLDKNNTPKAGWSNILQSVAATAHLNPEINTADHEMNTTGAIDAKAKQFFLSRGPNQFLSDVKVPTLILQGTVDDLFTLDEGIANYQALSAQGTTVSMAWFCGGHGVCLTDPGTAIAVGPLSLAWMEHYVAREASVPVLDGFAFVDQNGTSYEAPSYPPPSGPPVVATGSGTLHLVAGGGSGPPTVTPNAEAANAVDTVAYAVTPAPATNAVDVTVPLGRNAVLVGAPTLSLSYSGTVPAGIRPTRVFAQLVDPSTGIVVNNQITPIPVTLDGKTHHLVIPMETIGYTAKAGTSLELQLVATTVAYVTPRLGGTVQFSRIGVTLPTVRGLTVVQRG